MKPKRMHFEIARVVGPETVAGWRLTEHFGAHGSDAGYWSLTHLPTRRRVSRHRALGLTFSELVERAVKNEIAAAEQTPTVKNAMDVLRGLDESIRRRQAIRDGGE